MAQTAREVAEQTRRAALREGATLSTANLQARVAFEKAKKRRKEARRR